MIDWLQLNYVALLNVIVIDVVLAGDNAIIVGLAASRVAPELRSRVNGLRRIYGLMPFAFTDGALVGGTTIKAQHVLDLREGLRQAYVAASVAAPSYTNLTAGMIISAAHMTELRNAVAAIESR
jgi:hypothetical protein